MSKQPWQEPVGLTPWGETPAAFDENTARRIAEQSVIIKTDEGDVLLSTAPEIRALADSGARLESDTVFLTVDDLTHGPAQP